VVALALALMAAACGGETAPSPGAPSADEPSAAIERMKALAAARDWAGLYLLNAPSERREAEARWDERRRSVEHAEGVRELAEALGATEGEVASWSLERLFVARTERQAESPDFQATVASARFVRLKTREGDVAIARVAMGEREQDVPLRREGGRWYLWKVLTSLTDF
jgi:hypothetical protein